MTFRPSMLAGAALLTLLGAAAPATAQVESREGIALQNQILELRQELSQLQQLQAQAAPPPGALPPSALTEQAAPIAPGAAGDAVAQLVVRVSALEEQMRTLEGRVSELENTERRDHDDLAKQIGDLAFKLGQTPPGAAASGAADLGGAGSGDLAAPGPATSAAPAAAPPPRRTPELSLKQGNAALARRDYATAEAAAREVLASHSPRAADAQILLARAQAGQHEYKDAAATYYGIYKASPRSGRAQESLLGVANALIGMGQSLPACQALAKLSAEFPHLEAGVRAGAAAARKRASCHG